MISSIIESALSTKSIERSGDGEEIREYVFINDAAEMTYETLSEDYKNKHVFISGNQQIKVKDLLVMINEILGGDIKISYKEKDNNQLHYGITPYSYKISSAKRIVLKNFTDLETVCFKLSKEFLIKNNLIYFLKYNETHKI